MSRAPPHRALFNSRTPLAACARRAEADTTQDCQPELGLVCAVTRGPRAFLSIEETRRFLKE